VKLLENDEIAKEVSQQFDFVCIDEYQDTNGVQEYIIGRIANGHNLFMVGDSKQSIYQFRMTDPDIFLNKYNDFVTKKQEGESFLLNTNYRSSKDVLEFVNRLFDKIMTTKFGGINYASSSRLECGSQGYEASVDKPVEVARFCKEDDLSQLNLPKDGVYSVREDVLSASDTDLSEALYVAEKIASLVGEKDICELDAEQKPVFRKIRYSDIAILCKTRSSKVVGILNYLKSINIPVDSSNLVKKETNFCISLVVDFVSVVNNFRQDFPLINVMSSPIGGFSLTELAKIKNMTESKYFFEAFVWARQNENELQKKCMALWTLIERYRDMSFCVGVDELMKNIIAESDLDEYVVAKDGGAQSLQQLMTFVENLKNKNYNNSLPAFLAVADNLDDIAEAQTVGVGQENCIKAITIHASKGMEYPIVFVVDAAHCFNNEETKEKIIFDKDYGALVRVFDEDDGVYGKGLLWQLLLDYKAKKDKEEQMRLMYVALTRAKNMLFVSATKKRTKEETPREFEKASSFFDWIWAVCCKDKNFFCDYYVEPSFEKKDFELNAPLAFKFENPSIELVEQLDKWQQRNYEFELSTKLGIKYTVTEINNNVTQEVVCGKKVNNPAIAYAKDCKSDEIGTAYHKALECIDFGIKG
ncbi:MAG: 3'-5' exonuclease, partial [Clostridia bacterium]